MLVYLNGLYLLDPFFQACREGYASGVYRPEEVARSFRQSEYFLNYFHDYVLEDEVQFILQLPGAGTLSLSLGMQRRFSFEETGPDDHRGRLGVTADATALAAKHPACAGDGQSDQGCAESSGCGVLSDRELEIARLVLRVFCPRPWLSA